MKRILVSAAALGIAMTAAGCGMSTEDKLLKRTEDYNQVLTRVRNIYPAGKTSVDRMSGSVNFTGVSTVVANPQFVGNQLRGGDAVLLGDANVRVNFGTEAVTGTMNNFFGTDRSDRIAEYNGSITLSGGDIGATKHNSITANYSGSVSGNGDRLVTSGQMQGTLLGNPSVRGVDMGAAGTGTFNGTRANVIVTVKADRQK